eukprot:2895330-Amphidinium_carterae.1
MVTRRGKYFKLRPPRLQPTRRSQFELVRDCNLQKARGEQKTRKRHKQNEHDLVDEADANTTTCEPPDPLEAPKKTNK